MIRFRLAVHTLGCKLNQLETESVLAAFREASWQIVSWGEPADLYIINTCTVTSMAEQKARRLMRKVLRENSQAVVIATGCYAQLDPDAIRAIGLEGYADRLVVLSGDAKSSLHRLPGYVDDELCSPADLPAIIAAWARDPEDLERFSFAPSRFEYHSRGFLKIQDGCDNACSFCRVRLARGRSRSLAAPEVLSRLQALEAAGYHEAVLTGINLQSYNDSTAPGGLGFRLPDLLTWLLENTARIALRISSSEIDGFDESYARAIASPRVRPHFHLSVQSGSDRILRLMRRRYTRKDVLDAIGLLRSVKGDPFIACDIITGFPGESDEDFDETRSLCEEAGFAWIHAFPYSSRPGTEAAGMSPRIPERVAVERVHTLVALAQKGRADYARRMIGQRIHAIVETSRDGAIGEGGLPLVTALSENYLRCALSIPPSFDVPAPRNAVFARIVAAAEEDQQADEFDVHAVMEAFDTAEYGR